MTAGRSELVGSTIAHAFRQRLAECRRLGKSFAQRAWFASVCPGITHWFGEWLFRWMGRRDRARPLDLGEVERVLVVRLDKIGDLVLSSSFFRELRRNLPQARIVLVVSPASLSFASACPYVDEVLTYDWRAATKFGPLHNVHTFAMAIRHLWPQRFDLAITPGWGVDHYLASMVGYLSGAPWRLGYSECVLPEKKRLNRGFDRFFTQICDDQSIKHEVEHNLDVLRHLGAVVQCDKSELWTGVREDDFAIQVLHGFGVKPDDLLVAFAPGAGAPKRQWPVTRFRAIATWLHETYGATIVILGGPGEERLSEELEGDLGAPLLNLVGRATLLQTGAVLRRCRLFIGNDSGPAHLAAAAGTQVIAISCHPRDGSPGHENSPVRFGPWGRGHSVLQPETAAIPCSAGCSAATPHCINDISVEDVQAAVAVSLSRGSDAGSKRDHR